MNKSKSDPRILLIVAITVLHDLISIKRLPLHS
jgi:hypothetical protein